MTSRPSAARTGWIANMLVVLLSFDQTAASKTCHGHHPRLKAEISSTWDFLGPFPVGKTEVDGDPTAAFGGIRKLYAKPLSERAKAQFASELGPGGNAGWGRLRRNPNNGRMVVEPTVDWNSIVQTLNSIAAIEFQGWAVGTVTLSHAGRVAINCGSVHSFEVGNHTLLLGDIYNRRSANGRPEGWAHVTLPAGSSPLFIRVRARAAAQFHCHIKPVPAEGLEVMAPSVVPDLMAGRFVSREVAVTVVNHAAEWLYAAVQPSVEEDEGRFQLRSRTEQAEWLLVAPGQITTLVGHLVVPTSLRQKLKPVKERPACAKGSARVEWRRAPDHEPLGSIAVDLTARCRHKRQSFFFTFLDVDGAVSGAATVAPRAPEECPKQGCGLLLSLSGVGVTPQNQADAHKFLLEGEMQYGLRAAWVLAPEREGAHNWEGHGEATALASIKALTRLAASPEWRANVSPGGLEAARFVVTGHSRGGHGAWLVAAHHPDRVTGVIGAAGWLKREEYGDANIAFRHDTSLSHLDPGMEASLKGTNLENDVELYAPHLTGMKVLGRVGSVDQSVPPYLTKKMIRLVNEHGGKAMLTELPGKGPRT